MTPPRTILLVNAGQRDVKAGGAYLPKDTLRTETARLLARVCATPGDPHPDIDLPIVEVTVRAIISAGDGPIAVVAFGTDQADADYTHGDTVHAAALMAALLPTRFPGQVVAATGLPLRVAKANDHDDAYRAFREAFRESKTSGAGTDARAPETTLAAILGNDPTVPVIIAVSSGTPAANLGALLAAVETLGDRVRAIQPREDGSVARIDVAATIRRQALTQPAVRMLKEGQFGTAAAFIEALGDPRAGIIARLCRALHKWQDYDISGALAEARAAKDTLHSVPRTPTQILTPILQKLERDLEQRERETGPRPSPTTNQVIDLLWGADLCRAQGRLVDFVARVARLNEAILRRTVSRACGFDASDLNRSLFWSNIKTWLGDAAPILADRLMKMNIDHARSDLALPPGTFNRHWAVNVPNLLSVLDVVALEASQSTLDLISIARASRIIDVARPLHNKSIAGHAFTGVTDLVIRDLLRQVVPSTDTATRARLGIDGEGGRMIVDAMTRLLEASLLTAPRTNFFLDRYANGLAEALASIES